MPEFTTVIGVDGNTVKQLFLSHDTWRRYAPEIWEHPMLIFYDESQVDPK